MLTGTWIIGWMDFERIFYWVFEVCLDCIYGVGWIVIYGLFYIIGIFIFYLMVMIII